MKLASPLSVAFGLIHVAHLRPGGVTIGERAQRWRKEVLAERRVSAVDGDQFSGGTDLLDGYDLAASRRAELVDRMIELAVHGARLEAVLANVKPESQEAIDANGYPVLWAITWRRRSATWMMRDRALLLSPRG